MLFVDNNLPKAIMRFKVCGLLLQIVPDGLTIHLQLSAKSDCHVIYSS